MKKNISDILHNADDGTVERIADKYKAADDKTIESIYDKCISRIGTEYEQVEFMKAETVRRAPRFYPVLAVMCCLMIIGGSMAVLLKMKGNKPLPVVDSQDVSTTEATEAKTTIAANEHSPSEITAATTSSDSNTGKNTKPTETETAMTKITNNSELWRSTVKAGPGVYFTNTTKTTTQTTAKTTADTRVTTENPYIAQPKAKIITTKDIISLSAKKDDLTWSDFEEYNYTDIGSGLYIWQLCTSEGYTLKVGGGDLAEKPIYINLVRDSTGESIDIRYNDVSDFINAPHLSTSISSILSTKLHYSDITADGVQSLEVSNTYYGNNKPEKLTYNEINQILSLIKNVKFVKKDKYFGSSSINYSTIRITTHNGSTVNFVIQGNSFGIGNYEGYEAEPESLRALDDYVISILTNIPEPITVDVSGDSVYCWHDFLNSEESYNYRNIAEKRIISSFPDIVFIWKGHEYTIYVEKNGTQIASIAGMPIWSAYFTDINGDGSPELCMTVSFGSGIVDEHIIVYDLRNEKEYTLWERMEYDYVLFMENGELFVRKNDYEKSISSFWEDHIGEKGKLRIENNELVFVPVS